MTAAQTAAALAAKHEKLRREREQAREAMAARHAAEKLAARARREKVAQERDLARQEASSRVAARQWKAEATERRKESEHSEAFEAQVREMMRRVMEEDERRRHLADNVGQRAEEKVERDARKAEAYRKKVEKAERAREKAEEEEWARFEREEEKRQQAAAAREAEPWVFEERQRRAEAAARRAEMWRMKQEEFASADRWRAQSRERWRAQSRLPDAAEKSRKRRGKKKSGGSNSRNSTDGAEDGGSAEGEQEPTGSERSDGGSGSEDSEDEVSSEEEESEEVDEAVAKYRDAKSIERDEAVRRILKKSNQTLATALGLQPGAPGAEVQKQIRQALRLLHPDFAINRLLGGSKEQLRVEAAFKKLNNLRL